jgi:predicted transcriptional regulator
MCDVAELGSLGRRIMEVLWAAERPLLIREILERLRTEDRRESHYTTVQTVADRLVRRGLLERDLDGRAYRYRPTVSQEDHTLGLMLDALDESRDRDAVLLRFADAIAAEDARRLLKALRARRTGRETP